VHSKQRKRRYAQGDDGDEVCDSLERGTRNAAINKKNAEKERWGKSGASAADDLIEQSERLWVWACVRGGGGGGARCEPALWEKENKKRGTIFFLN
jgi:hypothetical protein